MHKVYMHYGATVSVDADECRDDPTGEMERQVTEMLGGALYANIAAVYGSTIRDELSPRGMAYPVLIDGTKWCVHISCHPVSSGARMAANKAHKDRPWTWGDLVAVLRRARRIGRVELMSPAPGSLSWTCTIFRDNLDTSFGAGATARHAVVAAIEAAANAT